MSRTMNEAGVTQNPRPYRPVLLGCDALVVLLSIVVLLLCQTSPDPADPLVRLNDAVHQDEILDEVWKNRGNKIPLINTKIRRAALVKALGVPAPLASNIQLTVSAPSLLTLADAEGSFTYSQQALRFNSGDGDFVTAYLLRPGNCCRTTKMVDRKLPCIVCIPGHSRLGVQDILASNGKGRRKSFGGPYQDFALQCVRHGYAALAIEQSGMGQRAGKLFKSLEIRGTLPCELKSLLLLTGSNSLLNVRARDTSRAIDILQQIPDVDSNRIAVIGTSAGGTTALVTAALDQRVKCTIVVNAFSSHSKSIFRRKHCLCNYVPGLLTDHWDVNDIASLIAPRYLYVQYACFDDYFPAEGTRAALTRTREHFAAQGCTDHLKRELTIGGHLNFVADGPFKFLDKTL